MNKQRSGSMTCAIGVLRTQARRAAMLAVAVGAVSLAKGDLVINTFDNSAELSTWRWSGYGGTNFVKGFSTDDAGGSGTSGSMDLMLTFDGNGGSNQSFPFTNDAFSSATDLSGYTSLDFDIKVAPGSAPDFYGNNGYFDLWVNNTNSYTYVHQFGDNVKVADGWRHVSVPLTAPVDQARAFTIQLFGGGNQNINGTVDLRLDNLVLRSSSPPGVSRAGHHFSYESPSQVDPAHPGHDESSAYVWGDSYQSSTTPVDHNQSTLYPTDGGHSMRMSQPLNGYTVSTQVLYNGGQLNSLTSSTKLLFDVTTPGHGPSYQTIDAHLNFGGAGGNYHYLSGYNANYYQFVDGNPGGANTRTSAHTQTYTWDFGGAMQTIFGQYWPDMNGYTILHLATGNGGSATGDPSPDPTSEYFIDNVRVVNEDTTSRPTWQVVTSGDWNDNTKWANGIPNGVGAPAIFAGIGAATGNSSVSAPVTVNSAITVGSIVFDTQMTSFAYEGATPGVTSANDLPQNVNYNLSGSGSLIFNSGGAASSTSEIYAIAGSHTIGVPVFVNSNLEIDTSAGFGPDANPSLPGGGRFSHVDMTSIAFTQTMTIANSKTVTTHGPGSVSFATINGSGGGLVIYGGNANLNGSVNVASLSIASAAKAKLTSAGGAHFVRTASLDNNGSLDITDNKGIVDYSGTSVASMVRSLIITGRNGGAWTGAGITSSTAAADAANPSVTHKTAVGYGEAGFLGITSFGGQSITGPAVLFRYTYGGDANLDGSVDTVDFSLLAQSFSQSGKEWQNGDFNYDGSVDTVDFNLLASNFAATPIPSAPAQAGLGGLVPEPASAVLLGLGAIAALGRRRRSR